MRITTAALLLTSSLIGTGCIEGYETPREPGSSNSEVDDSTRNDSKNCKVDESDEVIVRTEADFDELDAPDGCWDLYGHLIIEGAGITSLARLGGLRSVDHLTIRNTKLTTIDSERVIDSLGKTVITGNSKLTNVDGLRLYRWEGDTQYDLSLQIKDNPALENLDGFGSLEELDGELEIADNGSLTEIRFPSLTQAAAVEISGNTNLELLELDELASTAEITIRSNPKLDTIERLDVESVEDLIIEDNDSLQDLSGFDSLRTIEATLTLRQNATLSNIDAIFMMQGVFSITARDNAALPTCRVAAIKSCITVFGNVINSGNAGDLTTCPATPTCN